MLFYLNGELKETAARRTSYSKIKSMCKLDKEANVEIKYTKKLSGVEGTLEEFGATDIESCMDITCKEV